MTTLVGTREVPDLSAGSSVSRPKVRPRNHWHLTSRWLHKYWATRWPFICARRGSICSPCVSLSFLPT